MRVTEVIEIMRLKNIPSAEEFKVRYTHISRDDALRLRKEMSKQGKKCIDDIEQRIGE